MSIRTIAVETVRAWRRAGHVYGLSDCLLKVAGYGQSLCGVDIGAPWRGTYSTEEEALAIVRSAGGAVPLLGGALMASGHFRPVDHVAFGDAVVVDLGIAEVGGIVLDGHVAMGLARGVEQLPLRFIKVVGAWRCTSES